MKKLSLFLLAAMLPISSFAETKANADLNSSLNLNIRRIGLELSKTDVKNADKYKDSPIQQLKADSQDFLKGVLDVAIEYKKSRLDWKNSLFAEYGRTTLKPYDDKKTSSENVDKILLSSDLSYAAWDFPGMKIGPTTRLQYETEFTGNDNVPRRNTTRANAGFAIFEHSIIKDFYITGVYEYDFTYSNNKVDKFAAEIGWRLEYEFREGVKASTNGYYREYFTYSDFVGTDLKRDLNAVLRLDTNLWNNFTMGPYVQYRRAKSRDLDMYGSNIVVGVSFNYIAKFGLR